MATVKAMIPVAFLLLSAAPLVGQQATPSPSALPAAPPAWTIVSDEGRGAVQISATAKDGSTQFVGGCAKSAEAGISGAFSYYRGTGLRTDGKVENVAFYARGEDWQDAFAVQLRYSPASGSWQFAKPLSPVFLSSFSRGATLAVVNSRNQEVLTFDLTGSTAAVRAMRNVCGLK